MTKSRLPPATPRPRSGQATAVLIGGAAFVYRYLTRGGHLFITTPDAGAPVARLLGSHWYYVDLLEHISLFTAANLARLLQECGFRIIERRTIGRRYRVSYIERRLRDLSRDSRLLRAAHVAALPLRLAREARITLNLGDVAGIVAVSESRA